MSIVRGNDFLNVYKHARLLLNLYCKRVRRTNLLIQVFKVIIKKKQIKGNWLFPQFGFAIMNTVLN